MGLARKTYMIMHRSIGVITTKAVVVVLRPSKSQCYKNMFRATVASFSTVSKSYLYLEAIRHK